MIAFATISLNDVFSTYAVSCGKVYIFHIKHLVDVLPEWVTIRRHKTIQQLAQRKDLAAAETELLTFSERISNIWISQL